MDTLFSISNSIFGFATKKNDNAPSVNPAVEPKPVDDVSNKILVGAPSQQPVSASIGVVQQISSPQYNSESSQNFTNIRYGGNSSAVNNNNNNNNNAIVVEQASANPSKQPATVIPDPDYTTPQQYLDLTTNYVDQLPKEKTFIPIVVTTSRSPSSEVIAGRMKKHGTEDLIILFRDILKSEESYFRNRYPNAIFGYVLDGVVTLDKFEADDLANKYVKGNNNAADNRIGNADTSEIIKPISFFDSVYQQLVDKAHLFPKGERYVPISMTTSRSPSHELIQSKIAESNATAPIILFTDGIKESEKRDMRQTYPNGIFGTCIDRQVTLEKYS